MDQTQGSCSFEARVDFWPRPEFEFEFIMPDIVLLLFNNNGISLKS